MGSDSITLLELDGWEFFRGISFEVGAVWDKTMRL